MRKYTLTKISEKESHSSWVYPDVRADVVTGVVLYVVNRSIGEPVHVPKAVAEAINEVPMNLAPLYSWCRVNGLELPVELRHLAGGIYRVKWEKE